MVGAVATILSTALAGADGGRAPGMPTPWVVPVRSLTLGKPLTRGYGMTLRPPRQTVSP
jgi:hypothetical protein